MKITRLAALCLLAATACGGTPDAGTSAIPTPAHSTPADAVIVDKDQVLTCGEGEGEGSAQALCDAVAAAASPVPGSPEPGSPAPAEERPAPIPSVSQTFLSWVVKKGEAIPVPNPGTGGANPRLLSALLTDFGSAHESDAAPGAVVGLPAPVDDASLFIGLRMMGSPLEGPSSCEKWTSGTWNTVLRDFDQRGVRIAATQLESRRRTDPLVFGESVVTGPAAMLEHLADTSGVKSCRKLTGGRAGTGAVEPFPVPPLGTRSFAFRITGSRKVAVWQWVEVVQTPRYVLEVRIPNQFPEPRTDPAVLLPRIAAAAYARAEAALG
ncbi:hypothetical protein [Microbispora sp. NBRC 16548]|uniref:hypothetical protein n=1 Tax=Microbispora sp. NBRC 16548 TaxID=3030994 RepID=UPI0024A4366C|nr:hypothetical protein [Microbispora sp. NBRC 16548]GLX05907.1 hypothetical protein Misp03_28340 [Microbispora sp. NBRC 16548]